MALLSCNIADLVVLCSRADCGPWLCTSFWSFVGLQCSLACCGFHTRFSASILSCVPEMPNCLSIRILCNDFQLIVRDRYQASTNALVVFIVTFPFLETAFTCIISHSADLCLYYRALMQAVHLASNPGPTEHAGKLRQETEEC